MQLNTKKISSPIFSPVSLLLHQFRDSPALPYHRFGRLDQEDHSVPEVQEDQPIRIPPFHQTHQNNHIRLLFDPLVQASR